MLHPSELNIIVYAARNLKSKKKEGVCSASVVFGVGKDKYRTEIVKGENPSWNEEGTIKVGHSNASLVLNVLDNEDTIGNIILPVSSLPSAAAHKRRWLTLQRKNQATTSDLCFDCWVTQYKKEKNWIKFNPFSSSSSSSPAERRRESIASASTSVRGSTSTLDLSSKALENEKNQSPAPPTPSKAVSNSNLTIPPPPPPDTPNVPACGSLPVPQVMTRSLGAVMSMKGAPEITGISPRFGPSCGGTKITIRGCSLGCSADDFLEFTICSIDHIEVLEYHSPAKIVCLTQPWTGKKPNPGSIVLMTKSGGRGVSTLQFEFEGNPFTAKSKNSSTQGDTKKNCGENQKMK